jgi:uncharacterized membrane protein
MAASPASYPPGHGSTRHAATAVAATLRTEQRRRGGTPRRFRPRPSALLIAVGSLILLVTLVEIHVVGVAFTLAGLSPLTAAVLLLGSLLGSAVNIPIARIATGRTDIGYRTVRIYRTVYLVPVATPGRTTLAVNVGGAVIPAAVSVYLALHTGLWVEASLAVVVVAIVVHLAARPVPRVGIVLSPLLPAVTAALVAIVLHPAHGTAALAYIAGTVGTLVGADLTHLRSIRRLGAPVASIGGGGTFDGVFVSGILAVLLAAFV